jgi:hypothetical protein
MHLPAEHSSIEQSVLEASVARLDADIWPEAGVEHTAKVGTVNNKTSDRLDKIERQAEPPPNSPKTERSRRQLRAASPAAAVPSRRPARRRTSPARSRPGDGAHSIAGASPEWRGCRRSRLVLREVAHGGALIEGRQGIYEVYAGDPVPGLGRVDAIRKQDGRWVVVTSKGLVVAR